MVIMRKRLLQIPNFKKFKWYLRLHLDIGMNKKKCKEHLYFCCTVLSIFLVPSTIIAYFLQKLI